MLYHRWKKRFILYGIDGLQLRRTATHPGRPPSNRYPLLDYFRIGFKDRLPR